MNPLALRPRPSLGEIFIAVVSTAFGLGLSTYRELSIATYLGPSVTTTSQPISVGGYKLIPNSPELVGSFYGPWTNGPGGPNLVQGQQQFDVVDPATDEVLGTIDALVSRGNPLNLRGRYVELIVTASNASDIGSPAGDIPPVGSTIASLRVFGRFGWDYTAIPSLSGSDISFKLTTPLFNIPIPMAFNAAEGIADHTVDNRPMNLGNGYSITPSDPDGETYTATSGILPLFQTVQGRQSFDLLDSSGATVGSFDGVFTTTFDALGAYTQAVLVTDSHGDNIGTAAGQTPPVGSVYNIMYVGADDNFVLYTSLPSSSGNVISTIRVNGTKVTNIGTFPLNLLDASAPPSVKRLPIGHGYAILPLSPLVPFGVNGLPPREVQVQGYQQFVMYDPHGVEQGSFDATVTTQWDLLGNYSQAILVTGITAGTAGTAAGDVPPVGSMFNYVNFGNTGFGTYYSSRPSGSGAKVSFRFLTPLIDIPTWSMYNASAGLANVEYFDPFVSS